MEPEGRIGQPVEGQRQGEKAGRCRIACPRADAVGQAAAEKGEGQERG
jgi:hypothetical protein